MDPKQVAVPDIRIDLPLAQRMLGDLIPQGDLISVERIDSGGFSGAIFFADRVAGPRLVIKVYPREPSWRMVKERYVAKCVHFARAGAAPRWRGLLAGYGAIERPDWKETIELYRLYQAVEYWDWIAFLGRPASECTAVLAGIREIVEELS